MIAGETGGVEMSQEQIRAQAVALMKDAWAQVARQGDLVVPRNEAQVHEAVDLLRTSRADGDLLRTAEFLSCAMTQMLLSVRRRNCGAVTGSR